MRRPEKEGHEVVKKMSARRSLLPKARAHQAREVPQPSQVPQLDVGIMIVVLSAELREGRFKRVRGSRREAVRLTRIFGEE